MRLFSHDLSDGEVIAERFCFGRRDAEQHVALADNISPHLAWENIPDGAKSLALFCVDPDVPSKADDVNQANREIPASLARVDFYHWSLVDLGAEPGELAQGACSSGITPRGKQHPSGPVGSRQGLNNYTDWFAGDADMSGRYFGYDGPCPPWNDAIVHRYVFRLYALDCERLPVDDGFTGAEAEIAASQHSLDKAELIVTYTLNPRLAR
jgi:hypothetical protein